MIFLLRKLWTRNWVKCVSLPAEVAKPGDIQLCPRCFLGWGTVCAAEELTDVVEGFPGLLRGCSRELSFSLAPLLAQALGGALVVWQSCPWAPGKIQAQAGSWLGQLQCQRAPWAVSAPCLHPALCPLASAAFARGVTGGISWTVWFAKVSCVKEISQVFPCVTSGITLLLFTQIKHVKCNYRFLSIDGIFTSGWIRRIMEISYHTWAKPWEVPLCLQWTSSQYF